MPRPSNTAQRRDQISSALIRVMAKHGFHGATIAKVAKEARLASGLVLYHFDSKAEILLHAVDALVATAEQRYRARCAGAGDAPESRLRAFIEAQLALGADADEATVAAWVVVAAQAVQSAEVREIYARSVEARCLELEKLVKQVMKARGTSARSARRIAATVLSAIEGAFLLSAAAPGSLPRGYAAPTLLAMVEALLDASS